MIDWIALAFGLTASYLNAKKIIWCWPMWGVSGLLWCVIALTTHQFALLILQIIYLGFDVFGWHCWRKDETQKKK